MLFSVKIFKQLSLSLVVSASLISNNSLAEPVQPQPVVKATIAEASLVAKGQLTEKLDKITFLAGDFIQQVFDEDGNALQEGRGSLAISKPNQVRWHTQEPDETLIVSDGETLWFYDPFIEQVSAHTLANAIANTPILLLTNNDKTLWQNYDVISNNNERYDIIAKDLNSQVKSLTLIFTGEQLSGLEIKDTTGQLSKIALSNLNSNTAPDNSLFMFSVPKGVELDDQR